MSGNWMSDRLMKKKPSRAAIHSYQKRRIRWPIEVYKLWYEYCVLAGETKSFKEWFDLDLFTEPMPMDEIKVVKRKDAILTLEVDIRNDAKTNLRSLLKVLLAHGGYWKELDPQAKLQPTQSKKDMKFVTLQQARKVYLLKQKGLKNWEIAWKAGIIKKDNKAMYDYKVAIMDKTRRRTYYKSTQTDEWDRQYRNAERTVQRNLKLAEQIVKNVKKGAFP